MLNSYLFRVFIIPAAVFLSVVFGASYGSGREVVEFISSNGPTGGLVSLLTLVCVYALLLALSFELVRLFKTYDYVSFFKVLLGRGWVLYEIVILLGMVIALSIATTVGGTVLEDHFGVSAWIGSLAIFALIVVLNYYGRHIVEKSMMVSVTALFLVLLVLVIQLVDGHSERITAAFLSIDHHSGGFSTGLKYAIVNAGYLPLLLYCAMGLNTRSEAITAGLFAALIAVIPALVFHFAFMAGFPAVIEERLPTYWMFQLVSTPLMLNIYVLVMFVLIAQTGVGMLQGLVVRLDTWWVKRSGQRLSRSGHGLIAGVAVAISMALGSMGIVALILRGYTIMFVSFIFVFVIPLFTRGVYLVFRRTQDSATH